VKATFGTSEVPKVAFATLPGPRHPEDRMPSGEGNFPRVR